MSASGCETARVLRGEARADAEVRVTCRGETVDCDSIIGILALGAAMGSTITVSAKAGREGVALMPVMSAVGGRAGPWRLSNTGRSKGEFEATKWPFRDCRAGGCPIELS